MASHLFLRLLGPWQAQLDQQPLAPLPTRHVRALLARLALAHPQPLLRTTLQADLFPHTPPASASQRLRTALYYLRRVLGELVQADRDTIALAPTLEISHDVGRFEAALAPTASPATLQAAIALYRGPFLGGTNEGWSTHQARRLHHLYLEALHRLVALAQAGRDPCTLLDAARRWVAEEPWEEAAHLAFIRALLDNGDTALAERQLARARALLRTGCDTIPSPAFQALEREIGRLAQTHLTRPVAIASRSPVAAPTPILNLEQAPLVGRETELAYLGRAWAGTREGQAQTIRIEGVAGVGKTRLVTELIARVRLRADSLVLHGVANEQTSSHSLGLLRDAFTHLSTAEQALVRGVCAELDNVTWSVLSIYLPEVICLLPERPPTSLPLLEGSAETLRRQDALLCFMRHLARQITVLLALEDAHHADAESLALAAELVQGGGRWLTLLIQRPDAATIHKQSDTSVLPLAPLNKAATIELIRHLLGGPVFPSLLERLVVRSSGYPLFVGEILRALHQQKALAWQPPDGWHLLQEEIRLPDPVTDLLARRLGPLSPAAQELAQLLAVLGRPAEEALLARLWPDEASRLAAQVELLEQWVLREQDDRLVFDHDWLREALLVSLDDEARVQLHGRIVTILATLTADPAECLIHYTSSGNWEPALTTALAAAEQAMAEGRLTAVAHYLSVAETATGHLALSLQDPRRWPLLRLRERYHALAERGIAWQNDVAEMRTVAEANHRSDWLAESLNRHGRALREQGEIAEAEKILYQAAAIAHQSALPAAEAEARLNLVYALTDRGEVEQALSEAEMAVRAGEQSGDEVLQARALGTLAYAQMRIGRLAESDELQEALLRGDAIRQEPIVAARLMRHMSITKMARRDYEAGFEWGRRSVRQAQVVGDLHAMLMCQAYLFHELMNFGLYEEAKQLGEPTLALARRLNARLFLFWALYHTARLHYHAGDVSQAQALAGECACLGEALNLTDEITASLGLVAQLALASNDLPRARQAVLRVKQLLADKPPPDWPVGHIVARVYWAMGDRNHARRAAQNLIDQTLDNLGGKYLSAMTAVEASWEASGILAQLEGTRATAPIRQQIYERFVDDVARLHSPTIRRAFICANEAHQEMAAWPATGPHRLVYLPLHGAPTGRPLHPDEWVPVVWTLHEPDDPPLNTPTGRRSRLQRLCAEAIAQGAAATVEALTDVLAASKRTLLRDLKALRQAGIHIETRGSLSE